jgi:fumarylacetoacetate (FAA) hydrolase
LRLATLPGAGPDGRLVVVSRDLTRAVSADPVAATLQEALDRWPQADPRLRDLSESLEAGHASNARPFDPAAALAPLPRAWQWLDGSAYPSHGALMQKALGHEPIESARPLMYQGMSHRFLAPTEDVPLPDEADGIDFEGEFGVITDEVPMGVSPQAARGHIRLVVQINDWSLRAIAPVEFGTGFGFVQAKPACSMAPVAITPDELGDAWRDARVHLPLRVWWNDELFGRPDGGAMAFGFDGLVAHAARTRSLCAGTVIGSGTVSNETYREVGSTCIAERRGLEVVDHGAPRTGFMRFGDAVRMEAGRPGEISPFGVIAQRVTQLGGAG